MKNKLAALVCVFLLAVQPAFAACPAPAPGTSAEEIKANEQRLLCMQRELAQDTERRKMQMDIDALNRQFDDLRLQRQLDTIPKFEMPKI